MYRDLKVQSTAVLEQIPRIMYAIGRIIVSKISSEIEYLSNWILVSTNRLAIFKNIPQNMVSVLHHRNLIAVKVTGSSKPLLQNKC